MYGSLHQVPDWPILIDLLEEIRDHV